MTKWSQVNNILLSFPVKDGGCKRNINALLAGYKAWYSAFKKKWSPNEAKPPCKQEKIYSTKTKEFPIIIVLWAKCYFHFTEPGNRGHRTCRERNPVSIHIHICLLVNSLLCHHSVLGQEESWQCVGSPRSTHVPEDHPLLITSASQTLFLWLRNCINYWRGSWPAQSKNLTHVGCVLSKWSNGNVCSIVLFFLQERAWQLVSVQQPDLWT